MTCSIRIILYVILPVIFTCGAAAETGDAGPRPNNPVAIGGGASDDRNGTGRAEEKPAARVAATDSANERIDSAAPESPAGEAIPKPPAASGDERMAPLGDPGSARLPETLGAATGQSEAHAVPAAADAGERATGLGGKDGLGRVPIEFGEIGQVGLALAVVIALLLILRTVMVRSQRWLGAAGRPSGVIEILARYPVGKGQTLLLLKLARRILLVHQHGNSMQTLTEVSDPDEVASLLGRIQSGSSERDAPRFRNLLRQFNHDYEKTDRPGAPAWPSPHHPAEGHADHADEGIEVVDLTRRPSAWRRMLGRESASAGSRA